jgi:exodeoxyribonuclease-3
MTKIFSWNVNGLRAAIRKGDFLRFIKDQSPDILCLQETKASKSQVEIDLPDYEEIWNSADRPGYSGTAIFTKTKPLNISFGFPEEIEREYEWDEDIHGAAVNEGRIITAEFGSFFLLTVYVPNSKPDLSRVPLREHVWGPAVRSYIKLLENTKPVVICGDFNVAHEPIDLANPTANRKNAGFTDEERADFSKYLNAGLIDTFRYLHPDAAGAYTWWTWRANARARNVGWRIDYFLISQSLQPALEAADIYPKIPGSDHCPISITLNFPKE